MHNNLQSHHFFNQRILALFGPSDATTLKNSSQASRAVLKYVQKL